ncbi:hypothetical protein ACIBSV_36705 [Embleya sp. NPDC050154]|uniref:hypothetical protein n=1 Tax=Embleya sp. NPDC050154 TaxID=3363988 RepID=UPI0037B2E2CD
MGRGVFGGSRSSPRSTASTPNTPHPTEFPHLEIGTGSGYNTALPCRLVGAGNVSTVDHTGHLVDSARER